MVPELEILFRVVDTQGTLRSTLAANGQEGSGRGQVGSDRRWMRWKRGGVECADDANAPQRVLDEAINLRWRTEGEGKRQVFQCHGFGSVNASAVKVL